MKGASVHNGPNNAMGPMAAGKRALWGLPPAPVTHWDWTHGRDPE